MCRPAARSQPAALTGVCGAAVSSECCEIAASGRPGEPGTIPLNLRPARICPPMDRNCPGNVAAMGETRRANRWDRHPPLPGISSTHCGFPGVRTGGLSRPVFVADSPRFTMHSCTGRVAQVCRKYCETCGLRFCRRSVGRLAALIDRITEQPYNPGPFHRISRTRTPTPVNFSKSRRVVRKPRTAR